MPGERATSFGAEAEAYDRGRPGYPDAAIRACLPGGAQRVLDLAAGTGKLTAGLLGLGLDVVAVEPLPELRARIPAPARALAGTAEAIPWPDASMDAVLVGQAFHWFDRESALAEIVRVLRPGGTVGLLWNLLDDRVLWVAEVADAFDAEDRVGLVSHAPPWTGIAGLGEPEEVSVEHGAATDADGLVDNVASRSTVILAPESERAATLERVRALAPPGRFDLPLLCHGWRAARRS